MNKIILFIAVSFTLSSSPSIYADVVTADDSIIQGRLCVGLNCVNNESFGSETIRLKESSPRIAIDDTSTGVGVPANDWQLTFNDITGGGLNKFSVDDITNASTPFTILASAPTNSFFMSRDGNIGIGTSIPLAGLHITRANTPSIRLEQGGGIYPASTWDIIANSARFAIVEVVDFTSLNTPFVIESGAPGRSLSIAPSGKVGMGTEVPSKKLHVFGKTGTTGALIEEASDTQAPRELLKLSNNGGSFITIHNKATNQAWYFTHENSAGTAFNITHDTSGGAALRLTTTGNLKIKGTLTTAGSCSSGCDIVFSKEYHLPTIEDHAEQMWKNNHLPAVGPTKEGEPFNLSEKTGGMLNELEKAHIYIDQLNQRLTAKEQELSVVKNQFTKMEKRFAEMEKLIAILENK